MASSKVEDKDITECSICKEQFINPKRLSCTHTFCLECLKTYGKDERPGDEMACPLCRHMFTIPPGGFDTLQGNFFVEQLLESIRQSPENILTCNACSEIRAKSFCVDCHQDMCDACVNCHRTFTATRSHKVMSLEEKQKSPELMQPRPKCCVIHKDEVLKLYCADCKLAICFMCSAVSHKTHRQEELQVTSKKFCQELESCFPTLNRCIEAIENKSKLQKGNDSKFFEAISSIQQDITKRRTEVKRCADNDCDQLLNQLESLRDDETKNVVTKKEGIDTKLGLMKSVKSYIEELIKKGSACAIAQGAPDLIAKVMEMKAPQDQSSDSGQDKDRAATMLAKIEGISSRAKLIEFKSDNNSSPTRAELESSLRTAEQELVKLRAELLNIQTANDQLQANNATITTKLGEKQNEIDELHKETTSLKEQLNKADKKTTGINEQLYKADKVTTDLKEQQKKADKETASLKEQVNKDVLEAASLKKQLNKVDMETANLKEQLNKANKETVSLKEQGNKAHIETLSLKEQLNKAGREAASLHQQLDKANKKLASIKEQLNKPNEEATNLKDQLAKANEDAANLRTQQFKSNQELWSVKEQLDKANKELSRLIEQVKNPSKKSFSLKDELMKAEKEIESVKEKLFKTEKEAARLTEELVQANLEIASLKGQLTEAQKDTLTRDNQKLDTDQNVSQLKEKLLKATNDKAELTEQLVRANNDITSLKERNIRVRDSKETTEAREQVQKQPSVRRWPPE